MSKKRGGFGSLPLVHAEAFKTPHDAEQAVGQLKRNRIIADDCHVRTFYRTVRAGGAIVDVAVVVVRKKASTVAREQAKREEVPGA